MARKLYSRPSAAAALAAMRSGHPHGAALPGAPAPDTLRVTAAARQLRTAGARGRILPLRNLRQPVAQRRRFSTLTAFPRLGSRSASKIVGAEWCDSVTITPAPCSASWIAAEMVCSGAPPPSPMPFAPL